MAPKRKLKKLKPSLKVLQRIEPTSLESLDTSTVKTKYAKFHDRVETNSPIRLQP